jgi:hypothetical protein
MRLRLSAGIFFLCVAGWAQADVGASAVTPQDVYMPRASVSGSMTVDGRRYRLRGARGYHDHNWGEWIPGLVTWNWAQYTVVSPP